ncbi:hypothetical protein GJAV_G00185150 [Gymnothorax javanicus]|nr:hypothetical protein GJAV_G00185150 [Gymnothorax javanicus]
MADTAETSSGAGCIDRAKNYVKTRKGTILAAEVIISLVMIICYGASYTGGFSAVPICEMVFSLVFLIIFMMEFDKQLQFINWPWTDFIRAAIGALLYLITSLICVFGASGDGARIAGGVFGLLATALFAYDAYLSYMTIKGGQQRTPAPTDDA